MPLTRTVVASRVFYEPVTRVLTPNNAVMGMIRGKCRKQRGLNTKLTAV
jgi:hypothetical protein